jgi:hypothetical protein
VLFEFLKRHRGPAIAIGIVVVVLVRVGFIALFGGLGYEYALACGLLLPITSAIWTANSLATRVRVREPVDELVGGILRGALLATIAIAIGLLHGLRAGVCDAWGGVSGFVLGPAIGAMLGGAWGVAAGEIARARKWKKLIATLVAISGPVLGAAISVYRFYSSPMIFAFDPFVGYFSGTLYDTVVDAGPALLSYRAGSIAILASALVFASMLRRGERGLRFEPSSRSLRVRAGIAAALFLGVAIETACGDKLGHWSTSSTIARDLGGLRHGARCDVVYSTSLGDDEAALLVRDCDEEISEVEETLGAHGPARITAFFFKDAHEKKRLMGAADTYIAKPWRDEVYLQVAAYPHPVLGHEIAHVVAGSFGRGPFRIAGSFGGLLPNPGLIEGVAVATSPDEDELTDLEWAAAMKKRNALPPMSRIFSVGFLGQSAAKSYTLAGAFVRWVIATKGVATVRAWYAGASLEDLFGKSWSAIDDDFRASLDAITLPTAAEAYVASKFERPSVFGRKCPHEVDALRKEADTCRDAHEIARARELYDDALALDANEFPVKLSRAVMEMRHGDAKKGRADVLAIASDEKTPLAVRHKALDAIADDDLLASETDRAADEYDTLAKTTPDEDAARTLEVKAIAARDPNARPAVTALLIAAPGNRPPDATLADALIGEWSGAHPESALATYLFGKSEVSRGYYAEAATRFDAVLAAPSDAADLTPRIRREALRQRAVCACATSDHDAITRVRALADDPVGIYEGSAGGRRDNVLRLLHRCAH